ncbi:hypothetical protein T265_14416, partial [Opisthorchis viverrini]
DRPDSSKHKPRKSPSDSTKDESELPKSTLRVASSVPDLTITLRQLSKDARRRTDIRDLNWNPVGDSRPSLDTTKQPMRSPSRRQSKTPRGSAGLENNRLEDYLEPILRELHSKQGKISKRRQDTKRIPSRSAKRRPLEKITDEEAVLELAKLSPDILPEKVGKNLIREFTDRKVRGSNPSSTCQLRLSKLEQSGSILALMLLSAGMAVMHRKSPTAERFMSPVIFFSRFSPSVFNEWRTITYPTGSQFFPTNGQSVPFIGEGKEPPALLPTRRSSQMSPLSVTLFDPVVDDSVSLCSPNHLRYRFARSTSDVMLSKQGSRILASQPNLAASFGKLGARWPKWLECEFTDRKVRGSNPTSISQPPLSRLGQPGSIPALMQLSGGMAVRHQKGATAERSALLLVLGMEIPNVPFLRPMLNVDAPRDEYLIYNEAIASVYSYPWFHFIYALATLYLMTQLTNWFNPHISGVETLSSSWANMWMKLASSWIALVLYAWTIACPRLCIGRKLGETPLTPRTPQMSTTAVLPV